MTRQAGSGRGREGWNTSQLGAWAVIDADVTGSLFSSFNVSSYTDNGVGSHTLTWEIPFASASHYAILGTPSTNQVFVSVLRTSLPTAGSATLVTYNTGDTAVDSTPTTVIAVGRR